MLPDFIMRFLRTFDSVDDKMMRAMGESVPYKGSYIHENPDELGYQMLSGSAITPSIFRGTVATQETQDILCEIMPALDWLKIEENAQTPYETGLDNYAE